MHKWQEESITRNLPLGVKESIAKSIVPIQLKSILKSP
jgi:hypothetical protein